MRAGAALVLSAPSGAGKSTLGKMLLAEFDNLRFSISCTTRTMRPGEIEGKDYFFLKRREFEKKIENCEFAEWAEVHGNLYGTPLAPVQSMLEHGYDVLFDVDVQGAAQIKIALPHARFIFIVPPSLTELEKRLRARGCDHEQSIKLRICNAVSEIRQAPWYDAIIVNDNLQDAYNELKTAYMAAMLSPACKLKFLERILEHSCEWSSHGETDSSSGFC